MRCLSRLVLVAGIALFGLGCASTAGSDKARVEMAIADSTRLASHVERDASRRPADIINLVGVGAGDRVAELAAGGGYYAAILSRVVGEKGRVYAVDPEPVFKHFPQARDTFAKYAAKDPRSNIVYSVADTFDTLKFPEKLDAVFMVLYYHDTIWTGEDRDAMNTAIYDALKPGGKFLVVDHHAVTGAGDAVTRTLHRMDVSSVIPEVQAAGFRLVADSDLLANANDPRTSSAFDPAIRGKTDRFVYVFEKPARRGGY